MAKLSSDSIQQGNEVALAIAEIMGINHEQALQGSLRVDVEFNMVTVKWDGFAVANEEQRQKVLDVIANGTRGVTRV